MQKNIYKSDHTGAWTVKFREEWETSWTTVYVGGSKEEAEKIYKKLGN